MKKEKKLNIGKIKEKEIRKEMEESYIDYAMSVIISRALPDLRDGLKPVQRRILYSMYEMGLSPAARFRKTATVVGECFVKDTLILTNRGLIPIQEIKIGDQVYTQDNLKRVTRFYEMPEKPLLKITLENGISNIVTFSQKFKVLTPDWKFEWKEAKDLMENDYLVLRADYPKIKDLVELNRIEDNQPQYLNENIAYLLGILISDGAVSEDYGRKKLPRLSFGLGKAKEKVAEKIVSIFEKEFNYTPTIEEDEYQYKSKNGKIFNKKRYQIRINRKSINEFFVSNFELKGFKTPTKRIPSKIFQSPPRVIFSFISGLIDGDGCVKPAKCCIQYGSSSEKLIDGLLILLLHQGIFSSKYTLKLREGGYINGKRVKGRHQPYSLEIGAKNAVNLAKRLTGVASLKKQLRLQKILKDGENRRNCGSCYDIIPYAGEMIFKELSQNHLGGGWYRDINGNKFRMGIKYPAGCKIRYSLDLWEKPLRKTQVIDWGIKNKLERIGSPLFDFLHQIIENKIYFLKVASIRKSAPQRTYDLEVEDDHEFIANGIVSHNCLGKYHPHGDAAVYDALVRMAQDFSLRYPLIKGQGNFGSIDGDPPASMRYTECKMSEIGEEMLRDIEKNTVEFLPNYDGTRKEPQVLPSPIPQLLLNGTLGIAVGMATAIPPHNLSEICDALIYLLFNPKANTRELFKFIKGPDFPTGGQIFDLESIIEAYSIGRGQILMRGKAEIIEEKGKIVITEIPYQVLKSNLVKQIANLVSEKKIGGVRAIRDESDKSGMRIVIELKSGANPKKVLNALYKFSDLEKKFYMNLLALSDGIQPKVMSLVEILKEFLKFRKEVVLRRVEYDLEKAKERAHVLEGIEKCLEKVKEVISLIKKSKDRKEAQTKLIKNFGLDEIQANAILEMKLANLAKLERKKIEDELKEKRKKIKEFSEILKSPKKIKEIIKKELEEVKEKFGDERKTKVFERKIEKISEEELIPEEKTLIFLTKGGYIKRVKPKAYKVQKRGGKGLIGIETKEEDIVEHFLLANTRDRILFFTDSGKVYSLPAHEIPEADRLARGRGIMNFLQISPREKISAILNLEKKDFLSDKNYLAMATKDGLIKKSPLKVFKKIRKNGLLAIKLKKGDYLKSVKKTEGKDEIILLTKKGMAIRFNEKEIRPMGRASTGVKGIKLKKDELAGMDVIKKGKEKNHLLTLTENGYGKQTDLKEYKLQKRGGMGIRAAKINLKTGKIVSFKVLTEEEDLIIISERGQALRTKISLIPKLKRFAQGVKVMKLEKDDKIASAIAI